MNIKENALILLAQKGYSSVEIDDRVFSFMPNGIFEPFSIHVAKSVVVGRDITDIITEKSTGINMANIQNQIITLISLIDKQPIIKREYSNHYKWKIYLMS